jgi:hypothetical protein
MNQRVLYLIGVLLLFCCPISGQRLPLDRAMPLTVSLIRLIANPTQYDGQRIRVCGFLGYAGLDGGLGLYVSEIDARNIIMSNSVDPS